MKVVFFSKGDRHATSSRYRCFFFAEELTRRGVETVVCDPPPRRFGLRVPRDGWRELARLYRELRRAGPGDVVYLQRPIQNTLFVWMARLYGRLARRKLVFDFCDPIFLHAPGKTRALARSADLVVASCEDLAVWARRHNPRVEVVPNSFPVERIRMGSGSGDERRPVIGWIGSAKLHQENLRTLLPVLARLPAGCRFRLVGARGADALVDDLRSLPGGPEVEIVDWLEPEVAAAEIGRFDVAVLPLVDIPWNRKLVTKLVEYMAAGRPVVASPVGENRFAIEDGVNGFLAAGEAEWLDRLRRLIEDAELRRRLGDAALETVRRRYALDVAGQRLETLLHGLAG